MSSLALKFSSLAIRTLSKPIANFIKKQAREHEGFKRTCISFAQSLHRIDMRWRIGLLQDAAEVERLAAKEAAAEAAKKRKSIVSTVKTEAQTKAEEEAAAKATKEASEPPKPRVQPRIRPLSEAKAIESGATFISETFLFSVAAGLIVFESWRSRRKAISRRDDITERLNDLEESEQAARRALIELEREVLLLRAKEGKSSPSPVQRILPKEIYEPDQEDHVVVEKGWLSRIVSYVSLQGKADDDAKEAVLNKTPGPAEKILKESDSKIEEKRRLQALEDGELEVREASKKSKEKPKES